MPNQPGQPTKVEASKSHIKIRWIGSSYNGGVTIESYNVYSRAIKVPEVQFVKVKTVTDLLDLSYIELVPSENIGYVYEFYTTAINEVGEGVPSSIA